MRRSLAWRDPLALFRALTSQRADDLVFLHSSVATRYSGRKSWLAFGPDECCTSGEWSNVARFLKRHADRQRPNVFGYLGYEMESGLPAQPSPAPGPIVTPPSYLCRFSHLLEWDHGERQLWQHGEAVSLLDAEVIPAAPPSVASLASNMTRDEYLAKVAATREAIARGDFYQANITRKFHGRFANAPDPLALYDRLLAASPAPYSAFLRLGGTIILSSSPERFLAVDAEGQITARPIKGTRRRQPGESDAEGQAALSASAKDRAENLMIVDLMRNDLSRVAVNGSVVAERLFEADSFATLHHLSSTIEARLRPGLSPLDAVCAAFPPGSMTGAPKIAAVDWCTHVEGMARGVYGGALGWFARDACELSVVIRTLILEGDRFEFQVGGGIVHDSMPEEEWRETLTKARGMAACLGISEERLAAL